MSWMNTFKSMTAWLWRKITWHAKKAFTLVEDFIHDYIEDDEVGKRFIDFAKQTILELMTSSLSGEAKKKAAFDKIMAYVKAEGLELKSSMVNWAIENILFDLKANADD